MKADAVMIAMSKYLTERGYIKMNPYLYIKNVKTDIVTGGVIYVDLAYRTVRVMSVEDRFLCFSRRPRVRLTDCRYDTLSEFKKYIRANEASEVEFLRKDMDWKNRKG